MSPTPHFTDLKTTSLTKTQEAVDLNAFEDLVRENDLSSSEIHEALMGTTKKPMQTVIISRDGKKGTLYYSAWSTLHL